MDDVLTVEEAAKHLKVRQETIRRLLSQGRLPGNKVGRAWRIPESALMDFLRGAEGSDEPQSSLTGSTESALSLPRQ